MGHTVALRSPTGTATDLQLAGYPTLHCEVNGSIPAYYVKRVILNLRYHTSKTLLVKQQKHVINTYN